MYGIVNDCFVNESLVYWVSKCERIEIKKDWFKSARVWVCENICLRIKSYQTRIDKYNDHVSKWKWKQLHEQIALEVGESNQISLRVTE